jgi:general secretion pathway protein A
MYEDHFGLAERPFALTPDPRFWVDTLTHRKAMSYLGYGLAQGEGFIVVTGDIGAGKTTLVGHLMGRVDPARLTVVTIVSSAIEADDLLRTVAAGLGLEGAGKSKAELLQTIERGLQAVARTGKRTLLIVDEAQALPVSALEELRMLSNFQSGGRAMLQIFLLGQPEFRERLNGSDRLEQLRQRVIAIHHLDPMQPDEVAGYVAHRLQTAGWNGRPDFADDCFPLLYRATDGVPRRLNQLMGRVMLHAALSGAELIDAALIAAVIADADRDAAAPAPPTAPVPASASVPAPLPLSTPEPQFEAASAAQAPEPSVAVPVPDRSVLEARIAALETRIEEQDGALRRVLTLLVDWVENDARADAARSAA